MSNTPSFVEAPKSGADQHMASAHAEMANVSAVAAAVLEKIVRESLDDMINPQASEAVKKSAQARIVAAMTFNTHAAQGVEALATADVIQQELVSAPAKSWAESRPGAKNSAADEMATAMWERMEAARLQVAASAAGMEGDPALSEVLALRRQPGGVSGFFKRVGALAVSLSALGQRALALPGLVRDSLARNLDRADLAVADAMERWHTQFGLAVDDLRTDVGNRLDAVAAATARAAAPVVGAARATAGFLKEAPGAVKEAGLATAGAVKASVVNTASSAKQKAGEIVDNTVAAVGIASNAVMALEAVATQRFSSSIKGWWQDTALPALSNFASDVNKEFEARSRTVVSRDSFQVAGPGALEAPVPARSRQMDA
jgi:hypothetical protein